MQNKIKVKNGISGHFEHQESNSGQVINTNDQPIKVRTVVIRSEGSNQYQETQRWLKLNRRLSGKFPSSTKTSAKE